MPTHQHTPSPQRDGLHDSDSTGALALLLGPDEEWRQQALCAQIGGEDWFPEKGGTSRPAKAICNGRGEHAPCPVREECLRFALDREERFGIWGGLSERERRRLRPARPVAPAPLQRAVIDHGTQAGYKAHRRRGEAACGACLAGARGAKRRQRDAALAVAPSVPAPTTPPPRPAPVRRERPGVTRPWTPVELAEAVRMLTDYGMSPADIAAELHVAVQRVRKLLPARRAAA